MKSDNKYSDFIELICKFYQCEVRIFKRILRIKQALHILPFLGKHAVLPSRYIQQHIKNNFYPIFVVA